MLFPTRQQHCLTLKSIFIFKFVIFNWRIIDLQYCVCFCHTSTGISHRYLCPLPLEPPSHHSPHSTPLVVTEIWIELLASYSKFLLAIYFTYGNTYVSVLLSQFIPPFPSPTVSISLFSMSVSPLLPCKQVHQYHFSRFHIYIC